MRCSAVPVLAGFWANRGDMGLGWIWVPCPVLAGCALRLVHHSRLVTAQGVALAISQQYTQLKVARCLCSTLTTTMPHDAFML